MKGDKIPVNVLCTQVLANLSPSLQKELKLPQGHSAVAFLSTDCDDATYLALDEATKAAQVEVVYGRSLYAGAKNASTALAGEVIGVLSGPNPAQVESGLRAATRFLEQDGAFRSANDTDDVVYLAHCVSRTGTYLSRMANVAEGVALAYLIAPPVEAMMGLDAALKAADVELALFFPPPSETNFAGGLLSGSQSACMAACEAFSRAVERVAANPKV
ncbi:MAG: ethanolamine utilization microcompartment protein EutL [Oscillospiraceae bacterium]|nr:ethanolamine utilization microcompartment protein EutL [Oscillospiraceae bacterium]